MRSYTNLYEPMMKRENIEKCFHTAAKHKTRRSDVKKVLGDVSRHVDILQKIMEDEAFIPSFHIPKEINECNCKKTRTIVKPHYKYEQVAQHMYMSQFEKIVTDGLYEHVCGSVKKRGVHSGAKTIRKWIKRYRGRKFYVLKLDITKFFNSIDREILKRMLKEKIRDKRFLRFGYVLIEYDRISEIIHVATMNSVEMTLADRKDLATAVAFGRTTEAEWIMERYDLPENARSEIRKIVREKRTGVPLGYYPSQWHGNFYLKPLDRFILHELHPDHYIRYMDDMVLFGRSKKRLHFMRAEIARYLWEELRLKIKRNWQVFRFEYVDRTGKVRGRMLDFLGFQFHLDRRTLRKSILLRARRKAERLGRKTKISFYEASQMISFMGSITYADVYGYYLAYMKPHINVRKLKQIISKHARKERERYGTGLETCAGHAIGQAA